MSTARWFSKGTPGRNGRNRVPGSRRGIGPRLTERLLSRSRRRTGALLKAEMAGFPACQSSGESLTSTSTRRRFSNLPERLASQFLGTRTRSLRSYSSTQTSTRSMRFGFFGSGNSKRSFGNGAYRLELPATNCLTGSSPWSRMSVRHRSHDSDRRDLQPRRLEMGDLWLSLLQRRPSSLQTLSTSTSTLPCRITRCHGALSVWFRLACSRESS